MSINAISSSQIYQPQTSGSSTSGSLTTDQKAFITNLLSQYDSDSLSKSDAKEIVKSLQHEGIEPSKSMESTMAAAGFDAKQIGDLAGVGKGHGGDGQKPMGPPPQNQQEMSSVSDLLESLLGSDDEDTTTSSSTSSSFNSILDYTNKIVSLKDDAKSQVMDILNKYNSEQNTLSQEETQKFIVNSLSQVLKDSDNYNTMSFYA